LFFLFIRKKKRIPQGPILWSSAAFLVFSKAAKALGVHRKVVAFFCELEMMFSLIRIQFPYLEWGKGVVCSEHA
jgi:hypothetical protein